MDEIMHVAFHLHDANLSSITIANRLAVFSVASKASGCPSSCRDFRVRRTLEGWAHRSPRTEDT